MLRLSKLAVKAISPALRVPKDDIPFIENSGQT